MSSGQAKEKGTSGVWRVGLVGIAGLFLWRLWAYREALIDDAYISLRYGRNLLEGLGLVFNDGERVEGYTNFLWVILGSISLKMPISPMVGLRLISLAAAVVLTYLSVRLIRQLIGPEASEPLGGSPVVAVLICLFGVEALAYYATTGMESMLFASLFMMAFFSASGERGLRTNHVGGEALLTAERAPRRLSAVLFVLLAMTRPEGVLLFALSHAAFLVAECLWERDELLRRLWRTCTDGVLFGLLFGLYFGWRWSYYGEVFPNTYYAKVTGGPEQLGNGWLALAGWAQSHPLFTVVAVLTPIALWFGRRKQGTPLAAALWTTSVGWLVYVVTIGGDFMPFFRFFLPVLAPLAVLTVWAWWRLPWLMIPGRRVGVFLLCVAVQIVAGAMDEENLRAYVAHRTTVVGQQVGRFFAQTLRSDDLMAINTVGSLAFESRLPTLDMLGLTDKAIARHPIYVVSPRWAGHRRGWGDYVLRRKPRVVIWYNSAGASDPHYLGDHQLADHPFFRFFYQAKKEILQQAPGDDQRAFFLGAPFGDGSSVVGDETVTGGKTVFSMAELGAEVEVGGPRAWRYTVARPAAIELHYFELRQDHEAFWSWAEDGDLDQFLERVVDHWRQRPTPVAALDDPARREVEVLCQQALNALGQGDRGTAKTLLSRAVASNGNVRSPLPYQYITNLAYLEGNLFLAVHAQTEALRLEPQNRLYRNNLRSLLSKPLEDYKDELSASVVSTTSP